jgi:hypothetical protein
MAPAARLAGAREIKWRVAHRGVTSADYRVPLPQHRGHLAGEQACLLAGEGLDEQAARACLVDGLLEGADDLVGSAGDRDGRSSAVTANSTKSSTWRRCQRGSWTSG